jgi:organic hydroperoxide reductase OsmC/OhrA
MSTVNTDEVGAGEPMHLVTIDWKRGKWSGTRGKYSREHQWHFAGKLSLKVSDAMAPAAYRDLARIDPLKSYVATISSAHMLAWLHVAFSHEAEVESYIDAAEGVLGDLPEGRCWVSEVILRPRVTFAAHQQVTAAAMAHFHELAQRDCFIARSIRTKITFRTP